MAGFVDAPFSVSLFRETPVGSKVAGPHVLVPPLDAASYPKKFVLALLFFVANIQKNISRQSGANTPLQVG